MRLYLEVLLRAARRRMTYRAAFVMGALTSGGFGAIRCLVYLALYAGAGATTVEGFSQRDMISFIWIGQALLAMGSGWVTQEVAATIRSGDVVTDMMRPWNFFGYWYSRWMGDRLILLLGRGTLTYLPGLLFFGAIVPDIGTALAFSVSLLVAMLASFSFMFLVNLSAFWLLESNGVVLIISTFQMFLSGFLVPLAFFPPLLRTIAEHLPFQAITYMPVQVFLGHVQGWDLLALLAEQLGWALLLLALAQLGLSRAQRKLIVQGG